MRFVAISATTLIFCFRFVGGCNLQVAGRRSQVAGQNLRCTRTVNAKLILRKNRLFCSVKS